MTCTDFKILITFEKLSWGCLMSIIQNFGNSWDNLTISYNNIDIVCEVKGILSVDNKGLFFCLWYHQCSTYHYHY